MVNIAEVCPILQVTSLDACFHSGRACSASPQHGSGNGATCGQDHEDCESYQGAFLDTSQIGEGRFFATPRASGGGVRGRARTDQRRRAVSLGRGGEALALCPGAAESRRRALRTGAGAEAMVVDRL